LATADRSNPFARAAAAHAAAQTTGDLEALHFAEQLYSEAGLGYLAACTALQGVQGMLDHRQPGSAAVAARAHELVRGTDIVFPTIDLPARLANLTSRELEIAHCAAGGHTSAEIAAQLVIEKRSVESHLFRIYL
jgi:ATP/maltotriose-dependent transcriptional regulator MalT